MIRKDRVKKVLALTLLLVLALSTFAIAANGVYEKAVTAVLGRIKFKVDGKDVTKEIESKYGSPAFVVKEYGSRSYVPVRAIAELMGLEVEYDDATHTAEIIDTRSEKYEEELKKKDKEIADLKKEIKKLKEDAKENKVEETDIEALEKELNKEFGTYEDVEFEISLKESKSKITVDITMDLRDGRQESYWNRMNHSDRKYMIEDIVDIIASEFKDKDISGSIYDEFGRRDVMTFSKKKSSSSVSVSYGGSSAEGIYDSYVDDIVYDEFDRAGVRGAKLYSIDEDGYGVYLDIDIPYWSADDWDELIDDEITDVLDKIADRVLRYYYYDYRYGYDISIYVYVDGELEETYRDNYR